MQAADHPLRVLIVDDDPDIQDIVSLCIELNWPGSSMVLASDGRDGIDLFRRSGVELVVLDLGLPDIDGLTVCQIIRAESRVPIVMVTARGHESDVIKGLNAGADDYIVKPFSRGEFIARLTAVLRRGEAFDTPRKFKDGDLEVDLKSRDVRRGGEPVRVTATEFALLSRLIASRGTVVTSRELLEIGWGAEYGDAETYLDSVIEQLNHKVGQSNGHTGIVKSAGIGYRYVQASEAS